MSACSNLTLTDTACRFHTLPFWCSVFSVSTSTKRAVRSLSLAMSPLRVPGGFFVCQTWTGRIIEERGGVGGLLGLPFLDLQKRQCQCSPASFLGCVKGHATSSEPPPQMGSGFQLTSQQQTMFRGHRFSAGPYRLMVVISC